MKIEFRLITASVIAIVLVSAAVAEGARSRPLNEDAAMDLLYRTLKRDRVYEKRISMDCISYGTEETTDAYFQFVVREIHNAKCGGDPETSPAIDRYRVYRRSGKIQQWEAAEDKWQPYRAHKLSSVRFRAYANRARRSERDHDFLQIVTAATAVLGSNVFRPLPFPSCTPL